MGVDALPTFSNTRFSAIVQERTVIYWPLQEKEAGKEASGWIRLLPPSSPHCRQGPWAASQTRAKWPLPR